MVQRPSEFFSSRFPDSKKVAIRVFENLTEEQKAQARRDEKKRLKGLPVSSYQSDPLEGQEHRPEDDYDGNGNRIRVTEKPILILDKDNAKRKQPARGAGNATRVSEGMRDIETESEEDYLGREENDYEEIETENLNPLEKKHMEHLCSIIAEYFHIAETKNVFARRRLQYLQLQLIRWACEGHTGIKEVDYEMSEIPYFDKRYTKDRQRIQAKLFDLQETAVRRACILLKKDNPELFKQIDEFVALQKEIPRLKQEQAEKVAALHIQLRLRRKALTQYPQEIPWSRRWDAQVLKHEIQDLQYRLMDTKEDVEDQLYKSF